MRPGRLGLVAAALAVLFVGALPALAQAQDRARTPAAAVTAQSRTAGMAAAPAIITAGQIPCTLADARLIGSSGRGAEQQTFYEIACTNQLGFIVAVKPQQPTQPPQAFTCIETGVPQASGQPNPLRCQLEANANQNAALQTYVQRSGTACTISNVRPIGQTSSNTIFEVACSQGGGYVMMTSVPPNPQSPVQMTTCLAYSGGGNVNCTLADRAALLAAVDALAQTSDRACPVRDRRYVLTSRQGSNYYEIACQAANTGYMLEVGADGRVVRTIPCATAQFVSGGCTLTDATVAQTEQAGLYTRLSNQAGFNCQVSEYAALPAARGLDVVELKCSNRPDGAIGVFPGTGQAEIIPCAKAGVANYRCTLTQPETSFPTLTADLRTNTPPIQSCVVSASRFVGVTADAKAYIEIACADGLLGYFMEYERNPRVRFTRAIVCTQARGIGGGCTLPANVAASRQGAAAPAR